MCVYVLFDVSYQTERESNKKNFHLPCIFRCVPEDVDSHIPSFSGHRVVLVVCAVQDSPVGRVTACVLANRPVGIAVKIESGK